MPERGLETDNFLVWQNSHRIADAVLSIVLRRIKVGKAERLVFYG